MKTTITLFLMLWVSNICFGQDIRFDDGQDALILQIDGTNYNREYFNAELMLGYLFRGRLQVDLGAGLIRDGLQEGFPDFDGHSFSAGGSLLVIKQKEGSLPFNFKPSVRYQSTKVNRRTHRWLNAGAYISHEIEAKKMWVIPSFGVYWNDASGTSTKFFKRGKFISYEYALSFFINGGFIQPFYTWYDKSNYSFGITVGGAF